MDSVGSIYMDAGAAIFTDGKQVLGLNTSNNLVIGYEANSGLTHDTYIDGTDIKFRTGTTARSVRMFINGSGNVGIGTTSPAYLLDVNGNAHFSSIYADGNIHLNQGQQIAFKIDNTYRNTITVNANELAIGYGTRPYRATRISGQSMHLYTYSGSAAAERLTILEGGNVGIGTTSPAYLLDVNGNAHFSSIYADGNIYLNQGQQIAFKIDNTYRNTINVNAYELAIGYETRPYRATRISGKSMHLYTYSGSAAAERLTILEGGNVGIGTTSPAYLLDVNGNARCTSIRVGDALLAWDSTNNALKVVKSDGTTACNFYATGGVSALGAGNGQIETLQVGTLELTSAAKISANSSNEITLTSTGLKLSDNSSKQLFAVDSTGALTIGSSTQGGNLYIYYNGRRYQLNISQAIANGILS
jgi:cold shock CspA family protein